MENRIEIKEITIGKTSYQFRYESLTRQIEVSVKKRKKSFWSRSVTEYWEPFIVGDVKLYAEIIKFQLVHTNKDLLSDSRKTAMEAIANKSLLQLTEVVESNGNI